MADHEHENHAETMNRPPLHRLKSGAWIELAAVASITPMDEDYDTKNGPRVLIIGHAIESHVEFKSLKAARKYADELAEIRNSYDLES